MGRKVKGYGSNVSVEVNVYGMKGERIWQQKEPKVNVYGSARENSVRYCKEAEKRDAEACFRWKGERIWEHARDI